MREKIENFFAVLIFLILIALHSHGLKLLNQQFMPPDNVSDIVIASTN